MFQKTRLLVNYVIRTLFDRHTQEQRDRVGDSAGLVLYPRYRLCAELP